MLYKINSEIKKTENEPRRSSKRLRGAEQRKNVDGEESARPKLLYKDRCIICLKLLENDPKNPGMFFQHV